MHGMGLVGLRATANWRWTGLVAQVFSVSFFPIGRKFRFLRFLGTLVGACTRFQYSVVKDPTRLGLLGWLPLWAELALTIKCMGLALKSFVAAGWEARRVC